MISSYLKKVITILTMISLGVILGFYSRPGLGQDFYHGFLKDKATGEGISEASILINGVKGITTDTNGNFKILNPEFPLSLEISHVSYQSEVVIIQSYLQNGIVIHLKNKRLNIEEVEIVAEKIQRFFPGKYFYIVDYAFVNNKILIIGYDHSKLNLGRLLLTNLSQDTLSSYDIDDPKRLYKDGINNIHLFAGDSVFQLFIKGNKVHFLYPTAADNFPSELLKFQFKMGRNFYYKDHGENRQTDIYYVIDTVLKEIFPILTIYNYDIFNSQEEAFRYIQWVPKWELKMDTSKAMVDLARRQMESYVYDINISHKPINSRIFKAGDNVAIVDLTNMKTIQFDQNQNEISNVKNQLPKHHKIKKLIIQDSVTEKLYWVNYIGSKVELLELDINTGEVINFLETPNLPFIENIKIQNGVIWFLYQPRLGEPVRSLFRMNK